MKRSETDCSGCKEHPDNEQLPGVCSSCLRDKLSHLYLHSNTKPAHLLPSHSSSLSDTVSPPQPISSAASSDNVSPALRRHHRRNKSDAVDSVSSMLGFNYRLKKSRSIAFASRSGVGDGDVNEGWERKKDGFWSKLLKLTRAPRRH